MSIFRAVGWLLGVPSAEQRQYSKMLKEDEIKNIQKLKEKAQLKIQKEEKFKDLDLSYRVSDLINSFPITYNSQGTRLSINSNSYKMFETIVFKYIDDLLEELNSKFNSLPNQTYLSLNGKTIKVDLCSPEEIKVLEPELDKIKLKYLDDIKDKHIKIWQKKKTVEELQEVYDLAVSKEKNSDVDKIEMLEKEKRILELEKEIRELKANNRERDR